MMPALSYHLNPFGRDIEVIWEKKLLFFLHWRLNFAFNLLKGKSKYFPCLIASIKVGKSDLGKTNLQSDFNFRLQQLLLFWLWAWNGKSAGLIIGNFDLRSAFHFQLFNLTFPTTIGKCLNPAQLFASTPESGCWHNWPLSTWGPRQEISPNGKKHSETWFRNYLLKGNPSLYPRQNNNYNTTLMGRWFGILEYWAPLQSRKMWLGLTSTECRSS